MPTPGVAKTSTPDAAAGNPVDIVTLDAGAGTVDRQVFVEGDPTNATRYGLISAAGARLVDGSGVTQPVSGTFFQATQPISAASLPLPTGAALSASQTDGTQKAIVRGGAKGATAAADLTGTAEGADHQALDVQLYHGATAKDPTAIRALTTADAVNVGQWIGAATPTVGQKAMAASLPVVLASDQTALPAVAEIRASTLHVTGTAAVNTALTLTLPAAGAGLFHYITSIQWVKYYSVVGVAAAAPVLITSTNLPGNPVWSSEQAVGPQGTAPLVINYQPTTPLKSSVANTATTIVAPLQLQTIWRGNISYFTGA